MIKLFFSKFLSIFILFIVVILFPSATMAAGEAVTLNLSPQSITKGTGQTFDVTVLLNTATNNVSFVDLNLSFNKDLLQMDSFTPSNIFSTLVVNGPPNNGNGTFRYVAGNNTPTQVTGSSINVGTIHFITKNTTGTAQVNLTGNEVTVRTNPPTDVAVNSASGTYTIADAGRTSGPSVSLSLSPQAANKQTGEAFAVQMLLDTGSNNVSFVDLNLTFNKDLLQMDSFTPSNIFSTLVVNGPPNNGNGTFRYVAGNNTPNQITGNSINLGTINFRAKTITGTAIVSLSGNEVTVQGNPPTDVNANTGTGSYTIGTTSPPPPPPAGPPPPPPPVIANCNQSGNVKFRLNSAQSWTTSGTVPQNTSVFIAGFRNNDVTTLPSDITLSVEYNYQSVTIPPGNNVSFTPTQPGEYVIKANTSGNDCLILHVSGSGTTQKVRIAESKLGLDKNGQYIEKDYNDDPLDLEYVLKDKTPGLKQIWVKFIGTDTSGQEKSSIQGPFNITVLGPAPKIGSLSCNSILTGGVRFEIKGTNFGPTPARGKTGGVKASDVNLNIDKWSDSSITGSLAQSAVDGQSFLVDLTRSDGEVADEVTCSVGVSQIQLGTNLFCRQPSQQASSNVEAILAEGQTGGSVIKQIVSIGSDGTIKDLKSIQEGKGYKLGVKAPKSLRRVVEFIADKGTTEVGPMNLPVGDISPLGGDGKINSGDYSELLREWIIAQPAGDRPGDFNGDARINSFDWACMRPDFNQVDDSKPVPGPLVTVTSSPAPGGSITTTSSVVVIASPTPSQIVIPTASPNNQSQREVQIKNSGFSPALLAIKVGDTVTWTNLDSIGHSATGNNNIFDTGVLASGQSASVTFSKAGSYTYHCSVHPTMLGLILVQ